ncbi:MAG: hypothetical protein B7X60_11315, partial [Polynucleobacter sp. 39-45-136]
YGFIKGGGLICKSCESAKQRPVSGVYQFQCLACCVRAVASARPSRIHQEAMLAAIARTRDAPSRQAILDGMKGGGSNGSLFD